MLPLPRVGGALPGALVGSMAGRGARVKGKRGARALSVDALVMCNPVGSHRLPTAELTEPPTVWTFCVTGHKLILNPPIASFVE